MDEQLRLQARWRARLESELEELTASSRSSGEDRAPVELDQQSVGRLSRMDAMQVQAMAVASERRRQERMASLHQALKRLGEDFGYCEECGDSIPAGRLEADPTARYCVACARQRER